MSKPISAEQPIVRLSPIEQVKYCADLYRASASPAARMWLQTIIEELDLRFTDDELIVIAALNTPAKVQEFLNAQIYYNDDRTIPGAEETAMPPRRVMQTGLAHCFEGALFAYAVNFLHGYNPRLVLLESSQDADHNLVVFQDNQTGLYGCNAHSAYLNLDGRPAQYRTIRALAESYHPYYYSDWTRNPSDRTLVGYSDPIDLVARYGVAWIGSEQPLWDIYHTYVDDTVALNYLFDDSGETHVYPLIRALQENWIQIDAQGKPFVSADDLPPAAQELWHGFWRAYDSSVPHPRGVAHEIEKQFMRLTGTTPLDLRVNTGELEQFLTHGYRVEQLLTGKQPTS